MARKRMIDPSFWTDEKLGTMQPLIRLLFMGLISNADDEGRLVGHPALIRSLVFPYDVDITMQNVDEWLKELHNKESIIIYSVSNQTYIQIVNFKKYQKINRPTPSQLPCVKQLTDNSLNTYEQFTDNSRPIEEKRKEENRNEIEEKRSNSETSLTEKTFELCKYYEELKPGQSITAHLSELKILIKDYGFDWCKEALQKTVVGTGKFVHNYMWKILKDWAAEGKPDLKKGDKNGADKQHIESPDRDGIGITI